MLILAAVGVCFVVCFRNLMNNYFPAFGLPRLVSSLLSKYIYEPALVKSLHLRKFPLGLGYVPSRWLSILILGYVALNAVLSSIDYPTTSNNTWFENEGKQHLASAADRLGVFSLADIALTIMFSGRNSPLIYITGASRTDIITMHR